MCILTKAIYRFYAIPDNIPLEIFTGRERNPNLSKEPQRSLNSQSNPGTE